jgi:hypothetical protein
MRDCATVLDGLFAAIRYTQRGVPPSDAGAPYTIESHAADAVAVLDALAIERAWRSATLGAATSYSTSGTSTRTACWASC